MIVFRDFRAPWFKAGGNSAIYYAYDIAGRLGKKNINVNPDNDGHSVFDSGVVSFHGIRNLLENFEDKTDFEKPKILNDGWILIFDLKHTYDKSEIKALRELAKERKRKINALVLPKNCHPAIYNDILALIKRMVPKTFKLAPNPRQTFGRSIIDTIIELHSTFLQFTNGKGDPIELLKTMLGEAEALNSLMKILMELRLWDVGVCAPIAQAIAKLTTDLNEELSEREKNAKPRKAELAEESEDNSEDDVEISGAAETNENAENSETIERLADPKDPKNV